MSWNTSQLAEKNVTFCTPGTQSVHKWTFLGVPSDAENRVNNENKSIINIFLTNFTCLFTWAEPPHAPDAVTAATGRSPARHARTRAVAAVTAAGREPVQPA